MSTPDMRDEVWQRDVPEEVRVLLHILHHKSTIKGLVTERDVPREVGVLVQNIA